jgi:heme/copper-type cytochrome/quinol oxidase subunit 3
MAELKETVVLGAEREGPGSLFWIAAGAAGFVITVLFLSVVAFLAGPSALLLGCLFGVPAGLLAGMAVYSARQRLRGWVVLAIMVTAILAAWFVLVAIDTYHTYQTWGPTPLF